MEFLPKIDLNSKIASHVNLNKNSHTQIWQLMKGLKKFNDPGKAGVKMGVIQEYEKSSQNKNVSFYNEYG